jgi:hypothetical protein
MAELRSARNLRVTLARDPLLEAFVRDHRERQAGCGLAIVLRRAVLEAIERKAAAEVERRGKMRPIEGGRRDAA